MKESSCIVPAKGYGHLVLRRDQLAHRGINPLLEWTSTQAAGFAEFASAISSSRKPGGSFSCCEVGHFSGAWL